MMRGYEDASSLRDEDAKSVDNLFLSLICGQSLLPNQREISCSDQPMIEQCYG